MKNLFSFMFILILSISMNNIIAQATNTKIGGRVVSFEESTALEGVSVIVKGTNRSTGTQADGTFNIDVSVENKVLVFQHVEYETQEIKLTGEKDYDVVLKRKSNNANSAINRGGGLLIPAKCIDQGQNCSEAIKLTR